MTILIAFQQSQYRTLKHFYQKHFCLYWRWAFPKLVSYNRFVELIPKVLLPLTLYLSRRMRRSTRIAFIDSTPMRVCENRRIASYRVFQGIAERARNSIGWFYGFKLHLVINTAGELLSVVFTDDRRPVDELKNQYQLQHTRHRSLVNFQVNATSALIAYTLRAKKPSVNLRGLQDTNDLPALFNF